LTAEGELIAYRGLFLIDKQGVVQHQLVNNLPLGRSVKEALRMVDALQHFEANGEVCPMDWTLGDEAMKANHESTANYLSKSSITDVKSNGGTKPTVAKPGKRKASTKSRAKA
jgi:peroxiredoxin (alkyl hydroperoxide reductase subunit C)